VTEQWRKLYREELHNLNYSHNIIRVMESRRVKWLEHVALMGEVRNAHKILIGQPEKNK
jgi:hypothetical protein